MKTMILAAFAVLTLTAAIAPVANAASFGRPNTTVQQGTSGSQFVGGGD